ncbi:variant erythrocyte surface antigen-1 family protein [Babesia caballi]|uniref:Variant erythrocyte surface antigen-1 family protein n=1 Tax=Babesia caballi TaxID=5871 RepID=A0AAV4LNM9_BABCB|nr:variant erythrocyte surface antigen-1 family protein [Babesia caballi]
MTASDQKKLTDPPQNFKEAIDWVIKINELRKINDLAAALDALLNSDVGDVAVRVKGVYEKICEKFCEGCEKQYSSASALKCFLKKFQTFGPVKRPFNDAEKDIVRKCRDEFSSLKTSISTLAENLKKFLGWNGSNKFDGDGIILSSNPQYIFTYQSADWKSEEASDCAVILLAVAPMLFLGLGYIHWKCKDNGDWSHQKLGGTIPKHGNVNSLTFFTEKMGFNGVKFNDSKSHNAIVRLLDAFADLTKIMATALQKADKTAKERDIKSSNPKPNPYDFLHAIHNTATDSTPPTTSPLTSLYLLSYFYITYPLYKVRSSSPATPSFLGYSGTAALAGGAYGFNLGGLGTFMSALLA